MIICKKCHKAMRSETATEFCKCCYPEPEKVPDKTVIGMIGPLCYQIHNAQLRIQAAIEKELINQTTQHDNSNN